MKKITQIALVSAILMTGSAAFAQQGKIVPMGTIETHTGSIEGNLRWLNSSKKFTIKTSRMTSEVPEADVVNITVTRPTQLDAAIKQVRGGTPAAAVKTLEEIASAYSRLTYDAEATRWLAEAYVAMNKPGDAVKACEALIRTKEELAYQGEAAVVYWRALLADGKAAKLGGLLSKAVASGDLYSAAFALVLRGDASMAKGSAVANCREALQDGYLRVVLMYAESEAAPEACYKAAQAFDGMQQSARAQEMRKLLKERYGSSSWASKR